MPRDVGVIKGKTPWWVEIEIGPRRVGGRYWDGYWGQAYKVLDIKIDIPRERWSMTVQWDDGRISTHATAWDPAGGDRILS